MALLVMPKRSVLIGGAVAGVLLLYVLGNDKQSPSQGTGQTANTTQCRVSVTADVLNVRSTPGTDGQIVGKLSRGQEADADKLVQNGFRKLGENQWAAADFIQPLSGRDCG